MPRDFRSPGRAAAVVAALVAALAIPAAPAYACSSDDTAWFESFVDSACLVTPLSGTTLDALGGLRLQTNGVPIDSVWDTDVDLASGISWQATSFPPVGLQTLTVGGVGTAGGLTLPATLLPLTPGEQPVLEPAASAVNDGDSVSDPAVVKVGATYRMWYSGVAEDGRGPAIFEATSPDGLAWTRQHGGAPVLEGTPGTFDAHGVSAPVVAYDAAGGASAYRMWFAGQGDVFGAIGYATSSDGVTWTKHDDPATPAATDPVLRNGDAGAADSFAAGDPSVLKDGETWKMWYTGDDSSKKRIAYATSPDGIAWTKGGKVIAPEDPGANANYSFGAFAPTVWKTAAGGYRMLLTGRKIVSGSEFQTKVMNAASSDGITWTAPSPSVNPAGNSSKFDYSNLDAPFVLSDPGAGSASFKLWYAGNTVDATGNFHTRIGYATSSDGNSFSKQAGALTGSSVLDVGTAGSRFDARSVSGPSAVKAPAGAAVAFVGAHDGVRGSDFLPRLGLVTSADGETWATVAGAPAAGQALFALSANGFDKDGQRDPALAYEQDGAGDDWFVLFSALNGSSSSIGRASAPEDVTTKLPGTWSARAQLLAPSGAGFDASAVGHPSLIKDGASSWLLYYGARDGGGARTIGRAVSATTPIGAYGSRTQVLGAGAAESFDSGGVQDPVVVKLAAGDYRMLYTGIAADGVARVGYATSADGATWTKRGLVLPPSGRPFAADEAGLRPSGMLLDAGTLHVWSTGTDRSGRTRGMHATTAYPTPATPAAGLPSGSATYQLGNATTSVRDFRQITRNSSGASVELWMSFLQPYSSAGSEFWSGWFPVTSAAASESLRFLLTVRGVRWQARLRGPAGTPRLDSVTLAHAPVSFLNAGDALSAPISPPAGQAISAWGTITATSTVLQPSGGGTTGGILSVLDATSQTPLASSPLNVSGQTTLDLRAVSPAEHPALRARLQLTGDGTATPVVGSLKLLYNAAVTPPPPPPPPVLTMSSSVVRIVAGDPVLLTGGLLASGLPVAGAAIDVLAQPYGAATATSVARAATLLNGAWTASVKPDRRTIYTATAPGAAAIAPVTVEVAPRITFSARRRGSRATLRGTVAPAHAKARLTIQVRRGSAWRTFKKVTLTSASAFKLGAAVKPRGKYRFRVVMAADADHLAGQSAEALVDPMRVTLKATARGRTATFSGRVGPRHRGIPVFIEELRGTRWVTLARTRLSRTSTFRVVKRLPKGPHTIRARTRDDRDHFGASSPARALTVR